MAADKKTLEILYQDNTARVDWCPGCGDFGFLRALTAALIELGLSPSQVVGVPGIGCSGQIFGYLNGNTVKADHGRLLPTALGIKMANKNLCVIGVGGDGDGLAIGMEHFMNVPRTNANITYALLDNQTYGLTTGQSSPTSAKGMKTISNPQGIWEESVNPIVCALAAGATFIARTISADVPKTKEIIKAAISHKGFSFISDYSPCVTFNKVNTYQWFRGKTFYLENEIPDYDRTDKTTAYALAERTDKLALGIFYQVEKPVFETEIPLVELPIENIDFSETLKRFSV